MVLVAQTEVNYLSAVEDGLVDLSLGDSVEEIFDRAAADTTLASMIFADQIHGEARVTSPHPSLTIYLSPYSPKLPSLRPSSAVSSL